MTLHEFRFIEMEYTINTGFSEDIIFPALLRKAAHHKGELQFLLLFYTSISIPQVSLNTIRSLAYTVMLSTSPAHKLSSNPVMSLSIVLYLDIRCRRRQTEYKVAFLLCHFVVHLYYVLG